jgi:NADPH:quinone reductase
MVRPITPRKSCLTLEGMLEQDPVLDYRQMKTGEKYRVTPWG